MAFLQLAKFSAEAKARRIFQTAGQFDGFSSGEIGGNGEKIGDGEKLSREGLVDRTVFREQDIGVVMGMTGVLHSISQPTFMACGSENYKELLCVHSASIWPTTSWNNETSSRDGRHYGPGDGPNSERPTLRYNKPMPYPSRALIYIFILVLTITSRKILFLFFMIQSVHHKL